MTHQKLNLARDQLSEFLKNHEQIKQFEKLFAVVDEVAPSSDTTGISIQAGIAEAAANEALAQISAQEQTLQLLSTAPATQNNNSVVTDYVDFNTTTPVPSVKVGRMHWNGGYTLNLEMTPNVNQQIGESQYYYIKASAAITKGQVVMYDGAVGSSGVLKGAPATGVTNGQYIMGIAAENIANNDFGLISSFGGVRGFDTTGTPYGEVWADGDVLYYNPSYAGGLTKNLPAAPTPAVVVAAVIAAGSGGSGSVFVRVQAEPLVSQLSDVFISAIANGDLLQYDSAQQRWENTPSSALQVGTTTNIAGGAAGSLPYQSAISTTAMLPIGAAGTWLGSSGTLPQWNSPAALTKTDDTNVTLTLGGSASTALLNAVSLTLGWSGTLATTRGGTGTATAFTAGSIVFAGASGVYNQDNANLFWDDSNNRLGIGNAAPACALDVTGGIQTSRTSVSSPATTDGNIFSGTYTPSQVSTNTNVDSVTFAACQYMRVGNVVTVSGQITIDATTASADTIVRMSLPISSSFGASAQLGGVGSSFTSPYATNNLTFIADTANSCVQIRLRPSVNTALIYNFSFTYRII